MHILICNERLLFRFGLDRSLLIVGQGLAARGHRVSVMAQRMDEQIVAKFAHQVIQVPEFSVPYIETDASMSRWLAASWPTLFPSGEQPDVALSGGWPFFSAIPVMAKLGTPTVFMEAGAVPLDGLVGDSLRIQKKVRALRASFLPNAAAIAPNSEFTARSQSQKDAPQVTIRTVLLGGDHLSLDQWSSDRLARNVASDGALQIVESLKRQGRKVVLNLGRWEPGSYKASETLLDLAKDVGRTNDDVVFVVLADPKTFLIPPGLKDRVVAIGFPDDSELLDLNRIADVGVSVSRWEGFNLPLAEMQFERRPVLTLDVAAHPEVIAEPWFLCASIEEMGRKLAELLEGGGPPADVGENAFRKFAERFRWSRVVSELESLLQSKATRPAPILIDVSNATRDPANTGVIRVTRRLGRELEHILHPIFVVWDRSRQEYVLPTRTEAKQLSQFNGPSASEALFSPDHARRRLIDAWEELPQKPSTLLLTETIIEREGKPIRAVARRMGLRVAAIFYDAIPVLRPDLCPDPIIRGNHAAYMRGLAECDVVLPISDFSADCLRSFWRDEGLEGCAVHSIALPGEFGAAQRTLEPPEPPSKRIEVLCVSTLEPRKNHHALLEAFAQATQMSPDIEWRLTLVGNRYSGADDVAKEVEEACRRDSRIRWKGVVDDAKLHDLYSGSTFTVYPSLIEGFGLPVLESLWHGKPCLCHSEGVMSELASGGGCMTVDVRDVSAFGAGLVRLATDPVKYAELVRQAVTRSIKSWPEYARGIAAAIGAQAHDGTAPRRSESDKLATWESALYPGCLIDNWQMSDSERLSLTGILSRLQPKCSIEVGTYHGGSLSVISQFSRSVFSIDIDPTVPDRIKGFNNVSFLIGPSQELLPRLLAELDRADMPVEFVLIDGDHSSEGVRRDLEILLDYVPKKRMIVLLHDGFNPGCRSGILGANWARSKYVQWVDVDFVPGRVIEHGGGGDGEMWGGLAMAYFDATPRQGELVIKQTAIKMFERTLKQSTEHSQAIRCAS